MKVRYNVQKDGCTSYKDAEDGDQCILNMWIDRTLKATKGKLITDDTYIDVENWNESPTGNVLIRPFFDIDAYKDIKPLFNEPIKDIKLFTKVCESTDEMREFNPLLSWLIDEELECDIETWFGRRFSLHHIHETLPNQHLRYEEDYSQEMRAILYFNKRDVLFWDALENEPTRCVTLDVDRKISAYRILIRIICAYLWSYITADDDDISEFAYRIPLEEILRFWNNSSSLARRMTHLQCSMGEFPHKCNMKAAYMEGATHTLQFSGDFVPLLAHTSAVKRMKEFDESIWGNDAIGKYAYKLVKEDFTYVPDPWSDYREFDTEKNNKLMDYKCDYIDNESLPETFKSEPLYEATDDWLAKREYYQNNPPEFADIVSKFNDPDNLDKDGRLIAWFVFGDLVGDSDSWPTIKGMKALRNKITAILKLGGLALQSYGKSRVTGTRGGVYRKRVNVMKWSLI